MAGPTIIAGRPDLAHLVAPIDDLEVSTRIVNQLGITHGDKTEVLVTFVKKVRHDPFVSASICLGKELGNEHFRIIKEYDSPHNPSDCYIFVVKVDSSKDVDKLSGHI
ncbi:unnamed protein product [Urochloa humidicola]